jgi:hypothetical protein
MWAQKKVAAPGFVAEFQSSGRKAAAAAAARSRPSAFDLMYALSEIAMLSARTRTATARIAAEITARLLAKRLRLTACP